MEFGVYPEGDGDRLAESPGNKQTNKWTQSPCIWESVKVVCRVSGTEQVPEMRPEVEVLEGQGC